MDPVNGDYPGVVSLEGHVPARRTLRPYKFVCLPITFILLARFSNALYCTSEHLPFCIYTVPYSYDTSQYLQ